MAEVIVGQGGGVAAGTGTAEVVVGGQRGLQGLAGLSVLFGAEAPALPGITGQVYIATTGKGGVYRYSGGGWARLGQLLPAMILGGDAPPDDADGLDTDWFIDRSVPALWGPKADGTWAGTGPIPL